MGVVWAARDTRLDRPVAIKSLAGHEARTAEGLARMRAEARALAAINHPHVATVYELLEADGGCHVVMELLEGHSLSSLLADGPLPQERALRLAAQVASGLAAAHDRGIVHRDLKPGNVMVVGPDHAKVVDFGLASRASARSDDASAEFTGTAGYAAPEQACGLPGDRAADAWALGCVLFECLSGRVAFEGGSVEERLAATLSASPPFRHLPARTPARVQRLLEQLLERDPERRLADLARAKTELERALAGHQSLPHALPSSATSFVGREADIAVLREVLRSRRLVTLTGVGGCGKTRLALEVGRAAQDEHADGAWLVELAALSDPELVVGQVARVVQAQARRRESDLEAVIRTLRDCEALLVLDNCEHVLEASCRLVAALLAACPGVRVLATSREALGAPGEATHQVRSLTLPPADAGAAALLATESGRLFVERAAAARPGFTLDDGEAADLGRILRRLDGIPLALELAAARLRVLGVAQLLERLRDRFRLLSGGSRAALPRQQALRATIDWSHDLLEAREQALFRRVSVFAGGFDLEAAEAVGAGRGIERLEVAELLGRLVDKSLVQVEEGDDGLRYGLLETLRQYGREKLAAEGVAQEIQSAHRAHYLAVAERAMPELERGSGSVVRLLEREQDNMRVAVRGALEDQEGETALRFGSALFRFYEHRGFHLEGREIMASALALPGGKPTLRREVQRLRAVLTWRMGDLDEARALMEACVEEERAHGGPRGLSSALANLSSIAREKGDLQRSHELACEGVAILRTTDAPDLLARHLHNAGCSADDIERTEEARAAFQESLVLQQQLGERGIRSATLNSLGIIELREGHPEESARLCRESLDIAREVGDERSAAISSVNLGYALIALGRFDEAQAALDEALAIELAAGARVSWADAVGSRARLDLARGDWAEARRRVLPALAVVLAATAMPIVRALLHRVAESYAGEGRFADALRVRGAAVAVHRQCMSEADSADGAGGESAANDGDAEPVVEDGDTLLVRAWAALGPEAYRQAREAGRKATAESVLDLLRREEKALGSG